MKFDVSQANSFLFCPAEWYEKYINKRQVDETKIGYLPGYIFGKRFHKLLEEHYTGKPAGESEGREAEVENDCQVMLAMYKAWYPEEDFEVVEWEKNFEVPLSEKHSVLGRWDAIVRMKATGRLKILDTKTEKRGSKANSNQRWACLDQGSIYMYAGEAVFGEAFDGVILNVCTKASPKGQVAPEFNRLRLERSREQIARAVTDYCKIGDVMEYALEHGPWQHRNECVNAMTGWRCEFADLHTIGESPETLFKFKEAEDYLNEPN